MPVSLKAELRSKMEKLATTESSKSLSHRAKLSFGQLKRHNPKLVKGYTYERFYDMVCQIRKRGGHTKPRDAKPAFSPLPPDVTAIVKFLTEHNKVLVQYEQYRARLAQFAASFHVNGENIILRLMPK